MAASIALPPSRSTCAPASDASLCGVAMTPFVTNELSRCDDIEHAVCRRGGGCHAHSPAEVLAVGDHDLHRLEVVRDPIDHHVHGLVLPCHQREEGCQLERRGSEPLAAVVHAMHDLATEAG